MLLRNFSEVYKKRMYFMSNLYYRIEKLCKSNDMTITSMCKTSGASRASLSDLKMGRKQGLSTDTLAKIAKVLGVSVGLLIGEKPEWENAVDEFGFCWDHIYRESKKAEARAVVDNPTAPRTERVKAQITVFKALFSRSLEASGYDLDHVDFPTYISMILWQGKGKHSIPDDVYDLLVAEYGTKDGIPQGTYYSAPSKKAPTVSGERDVLDEVDIAFYGEFKELTEDDKETVRDMVRIMRERRAKKQE